MIKQFDISQFTRKNNTLTAEASTLGIDAPQTLIEIMNFPVQGKKQMFRFYLADTNVDEEVYGWRFSSGSYEVFIIND